MHPLGAAEHVEGHVLELDAEVLRDHLAAADDRDVFQHRLAPIAEARRLDRGHLEAAAQFVDDQGRQRLAFDVLGDDQQRTAALHDRLQHRQQRLQTGQLCLVNQDVRIVEFDDHLLGIGHEIRRDVAAVELHALDDVEFGFERLGLLDRDDALVADLFHRIGQHPADLGVAIGRDRADLGDFVVGRYRLCPLLDIGDDRLDGDVDAAFQIHRVHPGGNRAHALAHHRMRQDRRRCRAVARLGAGLGGDFLDHLRAHVLELVAEFDFLGDGNAVLGDARRAERFVENDVAALGAERHAHRLGQDVDAAQHPLAGIGTVSDVFCSHDYSNSVIDTNAPRGYAQLRR